MVAVRVRKNHGVDFLCRNWCILPVSFTPFLLALKQATIDQHLETIFAAWIGSRVDQMLGAGHHPRRSQKLNVGQDESFPFQILDCTSQTSDRALLSDFRPQSVVHRIRNPLQYPSLAFIRNKDSLSGSQFFVPPLFRFSWKWGRRPPSKVKERTHEEITV